MEIDRTELKRRAREAMGLTSPRFWVVALVYLLMTTGVTLLFSFLLSVLPLPVDPRTGMSSGALFLNILLTAYTVVVRFGYDLWSLWTSRRMDPGAGSLLQGFSVAGRVIWMEILILLRVFLWVLPISFLISLIIVMTLGFLNGAALTALLLFGGVYAAVWFIMLRYSLAPYLLADRPGDGAGAAVRRSGELMRGWTWELFKLEFSFLGWQLLIWGLDALVSGFFLWKAGFFQAMLNMAASPDFMVSFYAVVNGLLPYCLRTVVTLPLFLWLTPYRSVARAGFYDARLQFQRESAPPL